MSNTVQKSQQTDLFNPENYAVETLDDEIRVDKICKVQHKQYHRYMQEIKKV